MSIADTILLINDPRYPPLLKKIPRPPQTLFVKGKLPFCKLFAIVGTRHCTSYGEKMCERITQGLVRAGLGIVSGMAEGIDTVSHKACLEEQGETIAVLGTSVDQASIYPKSNLSLYKKIIANNGAVVSEYPTGTKAERYHFPERNRIISGLSIGVLVIEAPEKSGALITAGWAKKQGRPVFAVPGSAFSIASQGTNTLIKQGAIAITCAHDILIKLNIGKETIQKKIEIRDPEEKKIADILQKGAMHIEDIIKQTGINPKKIATLLSQMEIEGKIENLKGNTYCLAADVAFY